jgi:hypothetical protein
MGLISFVPNPSQPYTSQGKRRRRASFHVDRGTFNKILEEEALKFDRDGHRRTAYSLRHGVTPWAVAPRLGWRTGLVRL